MEDVYRALEEERVNEMEDFAGGPFVRMPIPQMQIVPAWLGIDSLRGRFMLGKEEGPVDGLVPPGQYAQIGITLFTFFKGERLFVKRDCASSFLIHEVLVGNINTKANQTPIIAEPFAVDFEDLAKVSLEVEEATKEGKVVKIKVEKISLDVVGQPWPMPACQPGMSITVGVENIGNSPSRFLAAFFGKSLQ